MLHESRQALARFLHGPVLQEPFQLRGVFIVELECDTALHNCFIIRLSTGTFKDFPELTDRQSRDDRHDRTPPYPALRSQVPELASDLPQLIIGQARPDAHEGPVPGL